VTSIKNTAVVTNVSSGIDVGLIGATTNADALTVTDQTHAQTLDVDAITTLTTTTTGDATKRADVSVAVAGKVTTAFGGGTAGSTVDLHGAVVVLNSATAHNGNAVKVTVTGTDAFGATITEEISYAMEKGMMHGTTAFHTITKLQTDVVVQGDITVGTYQIGDRIETKGNLTLQNSDGTPIKVEAVAKDHTS